YRSDQAVVAGRDHRCELVVEERVRRRASCQSEVDYSELADAEGPQVVFDALAELLRLIVEEGAASAVAASADLADQDQPGIVGVERFVDELVHHVGAVVLGGVDVVDAAVDGFAKYGDSRGAVAGRPEGPGSGELHGAEANRRHGEGTQMAPLETSRRLFV